MSVPSLARMDIEEAAVQRSTQAPVTALPRSLSVVLLVNNREEVIEEVIRSLLADLVPWADDLEVIAVERGSSDRSGVILEHLAASEQRLIVLRQPASAGYGDALALGLSRASKEFVCVMEADPNFDAQILKSNFSLLADYDAVLGFRRERWRHRLAGGCWNLLLRFMLGISIRDLNGPFKLYRAEFFRHQSLEMRGHLINAEIIYKFVRAGYTYTEVEIHYAPVRQRARLLSRLTQYWEGLRELGHCSGRWYHEEQRAL